MLDSPPPTPVCAGGKLACPAGDCGGVCGYDWVRSDYDDALKSDVFDSTAEGRAWLPSGWHPDAFTIDEANELIYMVTAESVAVVEAFGSPLELAPNRGSSSTTAVFRCRRNTRML